MSVVPRLRHGIAQDLRQLLLHTRTLGRRGKTSNTTPKEPSNSGKPCKKPLHPIVELVGLRCANIFKGFGSFWGVLGFLGASGSGTRVSKPWT